MTPPLRMAVVLLAAPLWLAGQLTTGVLHGSVSGARREPLAGVTVTAQAVSGGYRAATRSRDDGAFELVLPYGDYRVRASSGSAVRAIRVPPLGEVAIELQTRSEHPWRINPEDGTYPDTYDINGILLASEPTTVTEPLTFSGLTYTPLTLASQRAFSWTGVRAAFQGAGVSDPYQPGRTILLPDVAAISDVVLLTGLDAGVSPAYGSEIASFLRDVPQAWRFRAAGSDASSLLASGNLPAPATRGALQQTEQYHWFTREHIDAGGPVGRRADLFLSATGQWSSQTVPLAPAGNDQGTRLFFANARTRVRITSNDQLEGVFSGSWIHLSDWGFPAGLEALTGRRMAPLFPNPGGLPATPEDDSLRFLQTGWNHQFASGAWAGILQLRLSASDAALDTSSSAPAGTPSRIDLLNGIANGVPPLTDQAGRTRQTIQASYTPVQVAHHRLVFGAEYERAAVADRFDSPSNLNLITADGVPACVLALNTPTAGRDVIRNFSAYALDEISLRPWLTVSAGMVAGAARGSSTEDAIGWNSLSPRAGFAVAPGWLRRLVLRGSYGRFDAPLAGRYLDFGNPNSLGGRQYQWLDLNHDGNYQPGEMGALVMTFGGPYSSIDPALKRPYADEINVGAEVALPWRSYAKLSFFRRDEKNRIAAENVGVPAQDFQPVTILDPGPDGARGTFDDQTLTVYSQDPSSLGKDHYLLTNPAGLRTLDAGMVAEAGAGWRNYQLHASFMAVKSYGPNNPGNSLIENDAGVVGSLFMDPNTSINASGRGFFDRAYVGKLQFVAQLPRLLGRLQWANTVNYMDGLAFARLLLVMGLPQGPFVVQTTPRGSPGGGNRAEYVLNWNTRLSRFFPLRAGALRVALDLFNVTNSNNRIQESATSGLVFNQRLPVAIEPARFPRLNLEYDF